MNWVLILVAAGNFMATAEFDRKESCEAAKEKMAAYLSVKIAECFKK